MSALVAMLFAIPWIMFETHVLWDMTSPNAMAWNATLNTTASFGFNVIPIFVIIIIAALMLSFVGTLRGF